jgi:anti-anti-sigma factor
MPPKSDGAYQFREAGLTFSASASQVDTATPVTISGRRHPGGTVTVTVYGYLDFSTASTFHWQICELLEGQCGGSLELDLSDLDFCDIAGWRAIHAMAETAGKMRYRTRIIGPAPCLDTLLQLCDIPVFLGYTPPPKAW